MSNLLMYSLENRSKIRALEGILNESTDLLRAVLKTDEPCPLQKIKCEELRTLFLAGAQLAKSCSRIKERR